MAEEVNPAGYGKTSKTLEKNKRRWRHYVLTFAGIFLLSIVLPPEYKAFTPLLALIPVIMEVVNKSRPADTAPGNPPGDEANSSHSSGPISSGELYAYTPKDPKDPRRYKPIG